MDELGLDLEKAKKIEDYANTILGFCSDGANNTVDVALILALATAKMLKVFGQYIDEDCNISLKDKEKFKMEFEIKYTCYLNKFQSLLNSKDE